MDKCQKCDKAKGLCSCPAPFPHPGPDGPDPEPWPKPLPPHPPGPLPFPAPQPSLSLNIDGSITIATTCQKMEDGKIYVKTPTIHYICSPPPVDGSPSPKKLKLEEVAGKEGEQNLEQGKAKEIADKQIEEEENVEEKDDPDADEPSDPEDDDEDDWYI